jgi:hypothetical protein
MHDVLAHAGKRRARGRESGLAAADHDRQRPGNRAHLAAGNRGIEEIDAFASRRAAMSRAAAGRIVLMSTATCPALPALATPCSPSITCSTSGASATIEITKSATAGQRSRTRRALAPASSRGCIDSARRAQTVIGWPPATGSAPSGAP